MAVSRRIAWVILLGSIFTAGLLRQFHARIPTSPFLPGPMGSLLFFLILILFLVFARGMGMRQQIPYAGPGLTKVNLLAMIPLLIALMFEKWVSITIYGPLFSRITRMAGDAQWFNAIYVIESAVGLLLVTALLLPLFRRLFPVLRLILDPRGIPLAAAGIVLCGACLFGSLWLLFRIAGAEDVSLRWVGLGRWAGLVILGQALIAFAEEAYYRGLLQSELAFLLPALGWRHSRLRRVGAVVLVSFAFGLEHLVWTDSLGADLRHLTFTCACSFFLGSMMMLLDNLWFSAGAHFVLNLLVLGGEADSFGAGLQFVDALGRPLLAPAPYIFLFFIFAFVFTYGVVAFRGRVARAKRLPTPAS